MTSDDFRERLHAALDGARSAAQQALDAAEDKQMKRLARAIQVIKPHIDARLEAARQEGLAVRPTNGPNDDLSSAMGTKFPLSGQPVRELVMVVDETSGRFYWSLGYEDRRQWKWADCFDIEPSTIDDLFLALGERDWSAAPPQVVRPEITHK